MISEYGVTSKGFKRKTYPEILEVLQARAREAYGDNINLTNTSFLGMWLQNEAWELSELWEVAEDVYYSAYVDTSEGSSLDGVGKYITATRKSKQKSRGVITIIGREGTRIPQGYRIGDENLDRVVETTEGGIIGVEEIIHLPIVSVLPGLKQNVPPHTLVRVINPIPGIEKVYNTNKTTGGLDVESDREFRDRYDRSFSLGGSSTREAVEAALLDMDKVTDAFVEENDTMETLEGVPPKCLAPYVFGGEDAEVAKVILSSKAGGIRSYGSTVVPTVDSKGVEHQIGFTRPTVQTIFVRLNIQRGQGYPGDEAVTRAVLNYIGGEDKEGIPYKGLKLGENVVISKIMGAVMCLQGIKDLTVEVSLDGVDYQSTNLVIAKRDIARTHYSNVVISHV